MFVQSQQNISNSYILDMKENKYKHELKLQKYDELLSEYSWKR